MDFTVAQQLLVSLALGMLIGLQRERVESAVGGIRTFPLIMLLGTVCGLLAQTHGGWIIAAGFVGLSGLLVLSNLNRREDDRGGMTTEVAALLLFGLGAWLVSGPLVLVVVATGATALLLHWKSSLHRFASAVGEEDMRATMLFVLVFMVILPLLPNKPYGPYGVFNPFEIWLMVVLIVGMSLGGYLAYKFFGSRGGVLLSGVLGGMISSTATTVSAARQARGAATGAGLAVVLIMVAAAVAMLRVIIEIGVVARNSVPTLAPPLAAMFGAMVLIAAGSYFFFSRKKGAELPVPKNPAQLTAALVFAVIYAVIKLTVEVAMEHFGDRGLYIVGVISGLTDMDAITLSTARLVDGGQLEARMGWRTILIAAMSNLVFKAGAVAVLGGSALFVRVGSVFGLSIAAGGVILWLWPG
jgi:uncharacterized membrane protein (DUF4010 family)